ncbi:MAG: type IIL restriction-modification enzyme MmeI [Planctomycetaceae bacterium]
MNNGDGTYSDGRIDLYKAECLVWESKQGSERKDPERFSRLASVNQKKQARRGTALRGTALWAQAMRAAFRQAKSYAEALPEWPPFLIVSDIGYCIDVYADFSGTGKHYAPFPDPVSHRIPLQDLAKPEIEALLKAIWQHPQSLAPSKRSARVTRHLADRLAKLARSLETGSATGSAKSLPADAPYFSQTAEETQEKAHQVAQFLMRCLFTMFAEDVKLIPEGAFLGLLESLRGTPENFAPMVEALWQNMDKGGFSPILRTKLKQFNGGLFADCSAMPLNRDQLELLIEAAKANWAEVEPAIFGTLLERALDPRERHKPGAHYTPRAYVERLVMPTVIEPLREEWDNVYATAAALYAADKVEDARKAVRDFHDKLCHIQVLDPACGSGNFLYVTLNLMKVLEGEVVKAMADFGDTQLRLAVTIGPEQFLGIEINPRAAAIADLVLWIGYLQWHIRALGHETIAEPIIRRIKNIECRDAVLAWDSVEPVVDENGEPVTRWDGHTTKKHPVTGEEVPDEAARVTEVRYINPRKADWPQADYIVGNPPFVGGWKLRQEFGEGYTAALSTLYTNVPNKADYVMYWWDRAAEAVRSTDSRRFGFITTNSLRQSFNRKVVATHLAAKNAVGIRFAVPDHPWVDATDGADVRISMTVASGRDEHRDGNLVTLIPERLGTHATSGDRFSIRKGIILPDLTIGADLDSAVSLAANSGLSFAGVKLHGAGFILSQEELPKFADEAEVIKEYRNGRDISQSSRNAYVIDLFLRS